MSVVVYLLQSSTVKRRTYVGCSARGVAHRLRQHNGEITGGARQTSTGRPWTLLLTIEGFRTRQEALQFEYAWRRVHRRRRCAYCVSGRLTSLDHLMAMPRWSRNAPLASSVPLTRVMHHNSQRGSESAWERGGEEPGEVGGPES